MEKKGKLYLLEMFSIFCRFTGEWTVPGVHNGLRQL